MRCPTCSQPVPRDAEGLVQARVATRIYAARAARETAKRLALCGEGVNPQSQIDAKGP